MYTIAELITQLQRLDQDEVVLTLCFWTVTDVMNYAIDKGKKCTREQAEQILMNVDARAFNYSCDDDDVHDAIDKLEEEQC